MSTLKKNYSELTFFQRLRRLAEQFQKEKQSRNQTIFFFLGFAAFFLLIVSGALSKTPVYWFFIFALVYFWIKSNRLILKIFDPPEELLLILFFIGGFMEWWLLRSIPLSETGSLHFPPLLTFFHWINLLLMVWTAGLLLSKEGSGRFSPIVAYWLLFYFS